MSFYEDDDTKSKINALETAFKHPLSKAINRQLNILRRNGMTGQSLMRALTEVYLEHNMAEHDFLSRIRTETESEGVPRIICSEALV